MALTIELIATDRLEPALFDQVLSLCNEAYGEELTRYFGDIGPGMHLLGWSGAKLVSHAMWIERALYPDGRDPLRSAYVELVATLVDQRRRGFATDLMHRLALEIAAYDIGALSPAETSLYAHLGWERWRGPLAVRNFGRTEPTPGEELMILRLPGSPVLDPGAPLAVDWRRGEVW
jgi:GNAT superfamily N-acetyltransferase